MCGRFTQNYTWEQVHAFLSVFGPPHNLQPHYNIAPTDTVDVFRLGKDSKRELVSMRWGLIPGWWKKSMKEVMHGEMMWGMGFVGLIVLVLIVLGIAALVKYLFF